MKKHILGCTMLCILATTLYTGCKKEEAIPIPGNLSVSPASALPETFITITGTDMQDIVSIKFDTTAASFSSVFNTSGALFTTVPTSARYGTQTITIVNRAGQIATVDFTVLQPAPVISSFTPANAPPGDTITITGKMLLNVNAFYIGTKKATIIDSSSQYTTKIVIPSGAASGLLSAETAGGTAYSAGALTVGERAYLIADFDGAGLSANGNSWYSYGDISSKALAITNPDPTSGNFIKMVANSLGTAGYGGISTYTNSTADQTFGMTSLKEKTILKFDVNTNGKTATQLQVIVQETTSNTNVNNYAKTVTINGTGWNTVAIPLTEMFDNYGGGTTTPTPSKITTVKFHFNGYKTNPMEANIDNVRFAYEKN
jgi:hypothetical protein